jgi:hypothetical protein
MDVNHNAHRKPAFDASVTRRSVELPTDRAGEYEEHQILFLNIHTSHTLDNHGIPEETITIGLTADQAAKIAEPLKWWVDNADKPVAR